MTRILVTGARGFVGRSLVPALHDHEVHPAARPTFDLDDKRSIHAALSNIDVAYFLVHGLDRPDYASWESSVAMRFSTIAKSEGVTRIIYLGGIVPRGHTSEHLESRAATGEALRSSGIDVVELRAPVIIGAGGESWALVRDGAERLPVLLAPPWLRTQLQPVAIDDVVAALVAALTLAPGSYNVPGPEILTGAQMMMRTARLLGRRTPVVEVKSFPRALAAALAPAFTRTRRSVAEALFGGAGLDLVVDQPGVFAHLPMHRRLAFDEAACRAIAADHHALRRRARRAGPASPASGHA